MKPESWVEEEGLFQLSLSEWKGTESEASGSVSDSTINLYKSLDFKKFGVEGKFEKKLCQLTEKDHSEVKSWRAGGTMRHSHLWSRGCSGVYVGWVRFTFLFLFFFLGICVSTISVCGDSCVYTEACILLLCTEPLGGCQLSCSVTLHILPLTTGSGADAGARLLPICLEFYSKCIDSLRCLKIANCFSELEDVWGPMLISSTAENWDSFLSFLEPAGTVQTSLSLPFQGSFS